MALEVMKLLESMTFDFGKARKLSEEEHYTAFECLFGRFVQTLSLWCPVDAHVTLGARATFEQELSKCLSLDDLQHKASVYARQLYFSENDEFTLSISSCGKVIGVARIVMDPILFYLHPTRVTRTP